MPKIFFPSSDVSMLRALRLAAPLAAIALGAVVQGLGGWRRRVPLVVVGVALSLAFQHVLVETAIPVFTWPFLLGMWATLLLVAGARRAAGRG